MYDGDGGVRAELVDALERLGDEAPVIYEAPRRDQQAWLVNRLGTDANLANIAPRRGVGSRGAAAWLAC
jgi:phosphosulfolactate synthase